MHICMCPLSQFQCQIHLFYCNVSIQKWSVHIYWGLIVNSSDVKTSSLQPYDSNITVVGCGVLEAKRNRNQT